MERRLAAILMADMVGYSRLMSADEAGTLEALKTSGKNVLRPLVAEYGRAAETVLKAGRGLTLPPTSPRAHHLSMLTVA